MVSLDVKFTCDTCGVWVIRAVRIGPQFFMGGDNLPDGWVVRSEPHLIRSWCPLHSRDAK